MIFVSVTKFLKIKFIRFSVFFINFFILIHPLHIYYIIFLVIIFFSTILIKTCFLFINEDEYKFQEKYKLYITETKEIKKQGGFKQRNKLGNSLCIFNIPRNYFFGLDELFFFIME